MGGHYSIPREHNFAFRVVKRPRLYKYMRGYKITINDFYKLEYSHDHKAPFHISKVYNFITFSSVTREECETELERVFALDKKLIPPIRRWNYEIIERAV